MKESLMGTYGAKNRFNIEAEPVTKDEVVTMNEYAELEEESNDSYIVPKIKVKKRLPKFKFEKKEKSWKDKIHARKSWGGDARSVLKNQYNISEFYYE